MFISMKDNTHLWNKNRNRGADDRSNVRIFERDKVRLESDRIPTATLDRGTAKSQSRDHKFAIESVFSTDLMLLQFP